MRWTVVCSWSGEGRQVQTSNLGMGSALRRWPTVLACLIAGTLSVPLSAEPLAHELYVLSLDCDSDVLSYPRNAEENRAVQIAWLSKTDLMVSYWDGETAYDAISRMGSQASLVDRTLTLSTMAEKFRTKRGCPTSVVPGQPE